MSTRPVPLDVASIQETFSFNTNQFLIPVADEPAVDYEDLFALLSDGASSSGLALPAHTLDSGGVPSIPTPTNYSPVLPQLSSNPSQDRAETSKPQQKKADTKGARDAATKRVRDANANKNKQQNQLKELEALAAQKSADLNRLVQENSELKFRQQLLEKVVEVRNHQLRVMRGQQELPQPWCNPAGGACSPSAASGCQAAGGSDGGGGCCTVAKAMRMIGAGCLLSSKYVRLPPVDHERFRAMGKLQMMEGWKHFLSEVASPLLALESNPADEEAAVQLRQLAAEATFLFKHASFFAPDTVMAVMQTHLETEQPVSPDPQHWHTVVRTLELTPEQTRDLCAVYQLFSKLMAGVLADRKAINAHLAKGLHGPHANLQTAMEHLTVSPECEVFKALQRNMRREKSAHLLLRGFLFGRTLSCLQLVKASVYSYPWFPDATALTATVAESAAGGGDSSDT